MNNDDDFGQYNCISENIHGRMEAIVFVLSMYSFIHSIDSSCKEVQESLERVLFVSV